MLLHRHGDFPGAAFPGSAGAWTFTSAFLLSPPPPKNLPLKMKRAAATMITKIPNMATTATLLRLLCSAIDPPLCTHDSLFVERDRVRRLGKTRRDAAAKFFGTDKLFALVRLCLA